MDSFRYFLAIMFFYFSFNISAQEVIYADNNIYLKGVVIIKLKDAPVNLSSVHASLPVKINNFLSSFGMEKSLPFMPQKVNEAENTFNNIVVVYFKDDVDPQFISSKLNRFEEVEWAEPKFLYETSFIPNDPSYPQQYALSKIQAAQAWDITQGDTSVVVAIVDTGVDWDHPDLAANIWRNWGEIPDNGIDDDNNGFIDDYIGWDFGGLTGIPDNNPMEDKPEHGTHVAGIASAVTNNGVGIASIGFKSKVMAVKASQDNIRTPGGQALISYGYEGIIYAADNGADVINLSWGGSSYSLLAEEVIAYATSQGALVVAAAGNSNSSLPFYPASYTNVLSIASTDQGDMKSGFSNFGSNIDISAPGSGIYSTWQNDTYLHSSGTSMAAPLAAGLAALVKAQFPSYLPLQIGEQVRVNADDINSQNPNFQYMLGKGRINAFKAVNNANSKSVRAVEFLISDAPPGGNGNGIFETGETISITVDFVNYLNPTSSLIIYLESLNPGSVTVHNAQYSAGAHGTMGEFSNQNNPYTLTINDTRKDTSLLFKLNYFDGTYTDFQTFQIRINQTYATHSGNDVALTITSRGNLGYNDYSANKEGIGFRYLNSPSFLFEGALIVGTSAQNLSDAARSSNQSVQKKDFAIVEPFKLNIPGSAADVQGNTIFNDNNGGSKVGITVHLNSYSFAVPPNDNYIILRYTIVNNSSETKNNLYAGLFFDWDFLETGQDDITAWDDAGKLGYVYHVGGNPDPYVGTALISSQNYGFWGILNAGGDGGFSIYDGFSDQEKWQSISSGIGKPQAGAGDVSHVISAGPYTISPGGSADVAFMVAAGHDLEHLRTTAFFAREKYQIITDVDEHEYLLTLSFSLSQNYPNPFNPATIISFSIPSSQLVSLKLYDLLGREVKILLNKFMEAGNHRIEVDSRGLTSGVYFYKIIAGSYSETKKMLLAK
jgi:serine protease